MMMGLRTEEERGYNSSSGGLTGAYSQTNTPDPRKAGESMDGNRIEENRFKPPLNKIEK
jgi:hypothetical protein